MADLNTGLRCRWSQDENWGDDLDLWETDCGEAFQFMDGGPAENRIRFCCYCGKPVEAVPFVYPVDDEADDE
jgi:hypothetical protein